MMHLLSKRCNNMAKLIRINFISLTIFASMGLEITAHFQLISIKFIISFTFILFFLTRIGLIEIIRSNIITFNTPTFNYTNHTINQIIEKQMYLWNLKFRNETLIKFETKEVYVNKLLD